MKIEKIIKETLKDLGGVLLQICAITMICYQIKNDALLNMIKVIWILGFLLGLVEGYVVVFIALFFLHQPIVNVGILGESKFMDSILSSSPVLSNVVSNTNDVIDEVYILVDDYLNHKDVHKFNVKAIDSMLKYKIIDVDYMDKLIEKDKIKIPGITMVIDKYR